MAIDGRVAFAVSAFALAAALVALLDRIGVPEAVVAVLGPAFALAALACVGIVTRSMRISRFYAAGRAVPATYAGMAMAALAVGLVAPFLTQASSAAALSALVPTFGAGLVVAALLTGPFLRKTGAFSVPDLIAARFPNLALRLGMVVLVTAICGLVALASLDTAISGIAAALDMRRTTAVVLTGLVVAFIIVPGGTSGVVWSATGAAGVLVIGFALPLVIMIVGGTPLPTPFLGDHAAWTDAVARMSAWHGGADGVDGLAVGTAAIGIGMLAPLLAPVMGCRKRVTVHRAGMLGIVWAGVIVILVVTTMAVSTLALETMLEKRARTTCRISSIAPARRGCSASAATRSKGR